MYAEILRDYLIWLGFTDAKRTVIGRDGGVDVYQVDDAIPSEELSLV